MGTKLDRVGEKGVNNEGYSMEIVAYRGNKDIDVLVDGKYLRENILYKHFKAGRVARLPKRGLAEYRIGEKSISREGYTLEIVAYQGSGSVDVLVDGRHTIRGTRYKYFKEGTVRNPYHRTYLGVGYLGVGGYKTREDGKVTQHYGAWAEMLRRCYSESYLSKFPSYRGCSVCDEWHSFQVFAQWFDENHYKFEGERTDVDKDILVKNNKIYSPDTCICVPQRINYLVSNHKGNRGKYPVGVSLKSKGRYAATLSKGGKGTLKCIGIYKTPEEAFLAYKTAKEAYIKEVADEYKDKIPKKLYDALYAYTIEITD